MRTENKERNQSMVQDYISGMTAPEIAIKHDTQASYVFRILKGAGVKRHTRGGKRRKIEHNADRKWIDKQILALTRQGFTIPEIMQRYEVTYNRVVKVRKESGLIRIGRAFLSRDAKCFNGFEIPEIELGITARPKRTQRIAI